MEFKKILVPVDGSYISEMAAEMAIGSAHIFGSALTFAYIVDPSNYRGSISEESDMDLDATQGRMFLDRMAKKANASKCECTTKIYEGHPFEIIVDLSKEFDQIIMSIKGKSGLKILGSTAEKVVEHSHCPVITIKSISDRIEKVMLPVADKHDDAIDLAIETVKMINGRLTVFSVGGPEAQGLVDDVVNLCKEKGIDAFGEIAEGDPAETICAQSGRYDLIIMGTEGRSGFKKILNGSVAEKVMVGASCPVTIIRKKLQ